MVPKHPFRQVFGDWGRGPLTLVTAELSALGRDHARR